MIKITETMSILILKDSKRQRTERYRGRLTHRLRGGAGVRFTLTDLVMLDSEFVESWCCFSSSFTEIPLSQTFACVFLLSELYKQGLSHNSDTDTG